MSGRAITGERTIEDLQYDLKYIPYKGKQICVYTFGTGEKTIFSLPSFPHSGLSYLLFLKFCPEITNVRFITFDLPGWIGRSDNIFTKNNYDMDELILMAETILETEKIEKFSMIGYSFGGRLAVRIAARNPERINKIALVSTIINGRLCDKLTIVRGINLAYRLKLGRVFRRITENKASKYLRIMVEQGILSSIFVKEYRILLKHLDGAAALTSIHHFFQSDWSDDLRAIKDKPFLIVNSRDEAQMFKTQAKSIREILPHEVNYLIEGSHEDFLVSPTKSYIHNVLKFLTD